MNLDEWRSRGSLVTVHDRKVFVVDTGPSDRPTLVILHGYTTSSHDFHRVLPQLTEHFRVVVHDHLGFGLSDKPRDYSYGLFEQADVALMLWRQLDVGPVHVLAHDYGTSVATELLARWVRGFRPLELRSLTLCNGSMHIEKADLRVVQKLLLSRRLGPLTARLSNRAVFDVNMRRLWHDPSTIVPEDFDTMWQLLEHNEGRQVLAQVTQYLRDRRTYWHRWLGALKTTPLPTSFVWGVEDPVVGGDVARLHHDETPNSQLRLLEDVGHYPMLEAPQRWTDAVLDVLGA